jgi:DNA polymerase III alpha subunit
LAKDYTRQIEPEMDGAPVTLGGVITGVRPLATKDRRPFIAATLEDLEGSIEVTVWPDVYARTQELWKDGTIVIVQGRVRVRDERVSVSCDTARLFGEQGAQEEGDGPAPAAPPSGPSTMAQPREQPAPSAKQHSNGSPPQKNGAKTIALRLREGHDPRKDVERLHQVLSLLQARPGPDIVRLYVESGGTVRRLDLPNLSTGYSPALHRQLVALLGEDGIRLEGTHPDA